MKNHTLAYLAETASHDAAVDLINEEAFGPGRFARAAARIREQGAHDRALSFVCTDDGAVIASVRMTAVMAGTVKGHLLGPLAVRPSHKNLGIGRELVRIAIEAARLTASEGVILVGDPPYYMPLGFEKVAYGALEFPGPVDPGRVLVVPLAQDVHARLKGVIGWRAEAAGDGTVLSVASLADGTAQSVGSPPSALPGISPTRGEIGKVAAVSR